MSHEVFPVPLELLHVIVTIRVWNAPGPILHGEDVDEQLDLDEDHSTGEVYSKKLQKTLVAESLLPSRHLVLEVCSPAIMTLLSEVSGGRDRSLKGLESCAEESGGVLISDPCDIETTEIPMLQHMVFPQTHAQSTTAQAGQTGHTSVNVRR